MDYLPALSIGIGGWMVLNGILHDVAVLRSDHGRQYDRNLLRLLMDGHILFTCGVIQMIAFLGFRNNELWAYYVSATACVSMLVYCAMIFPFLKSFFTIGLNLLLLVMLVIGFFK